MLRVIAITAVLGFAASARLDHLYLPPNQRTSSGNAFGGYSGGSASAQAYSSSSFKNIPIVKFAADNNGEGSYSYNYETGNSINAEETGNAQGDGTKAHGSYSYTAPDGQLVSITYTADENGFVPQGSHIPTPPPIPEAILKSLQDNAAAEARGVFDDGQYKGEGLNEGQYHGEGQEHGFKSAGSAGYSYGNNGGYKY